MELIEAIQLKALNDILGENPEYSVRRIFRWYSTTYHTPLHIVETLPIEYVFQHFFEATIETLSTAARNKLVRELIESKEEKLARLKEESGLTDEEFFKKVKREERKAAKKRKAKLDKAKKDAQLDMDFLSPEKVKATVAKALSNTKPNPPPIIEELPEINMDFGSNLDDTDALAPK